MEDLSLGHVRPLRIGDRVLVPAADVLRLRRELPAEWIPPADFRGLELGDLDPVAAYELLDSGIRDALPYVEETPDYEIPASHWILERALSCLPGEPPLEPEVAKLKQAVYRLIDSDEHFVPRKVETDELVTVFSWEDVWARLMRADATLYPRRAQLEAPLSELVAVVRALDISEQELTGVDGECGVELALARPAHLWERLLDVASDVGVRY